MDEYLRSRLSPPSSGLGTVTVESNVEFVDDQSGDLDIPSHAGGHPVERYHLKPLAELYDRGNNKPVDPLDDDFMPLFYAIEEEFVRSDHSAACREDSDVAIALDLLASGPDGDLRHNVLARRVQLALRLLLSLNNFSRDEVRQALRKIRKSVDRHHREGGRRGYLNFLHEYL